MKNIIKKTLEIKKNKQTKNFFLGNDIPVDFILKKEKNVYQKRINFVSYAICFCFFIIVIRVLFLTISFDFFKNSINRNIKNKSSFYRPDIIDRNGEILATNLPTLDLYANIKNIVNPENSAKELVKILTFLDYENVLKKLKSNRKYIQISRKISPLEKEKIFLIGEPGFEFSNNEDRVYPHSNLFSHIVGSINIDNKGISGIERYIDGNNLVKSDEPIQLSVDTYIQHAIRQNLYDAMEKYNAISAAGIVMDVKTGEILGMVSLPDFHNSEYGKVVTNPLYTNHVTQDLYEMGSVMKIINTSLAIENGYPQDKLFNVKKPFKIGDYEIKDSNTPKTYLNISEGFIHSSNIVMANIAKDLGIKKQKSFFDELNLLSRLDFEMPEKSLPIIPKKWDENISASISFGYGISPSILHTISAINGIVNDGLYISPSILKKDENSVLKSYQVVSSKTSEKIRELMRLVITNGTGSMANLENIKVAGKTGTSNKIIDGKYSKNKNRTFFVSIFPADQPKYTMLIMLDEANNNGCDSSSCTVVPVSAKIIDDITPILNLDLK